MAVYATPEHHAFLFAALCRALHEAFPQQAAQVCADAVRQYGEQRGRRMALRTRLDGYTPDVENYLLYGEWSAEPGTSQSAVTQLWPEVVMQCTRCPWHALWEETDSLPYGRIYCQSIDASLARGYCGMTLRTESCLTAGDGQCTFAFEGCGVPPARQEGMQARAAALGDRAKLPWDYHCAHLYAAFLSAAKALGPQGVSACASALGALKARYDSALIDAVLARSGDDFDALPRRE